MKSKDILTTKIEVALFKGSLEADGKNVFVRCDSNLSEGLVFSRKELKEASDYFKHLASLIEGK